MRTNNNQTEYCNTQVAVLKKAVEGFSKSITLNLTDVDEELHDLIRNGQVQKFEYSAMLLWHALKYYLHAYKNINESSPRAIIKAFFLSEKLSSKLYEALIMMIDHHNQYSLGYDDAKFLELYSHLPIHARTLQEVLRILDSKVQLKENAKV